MTLLADLAVGLIALLHVYILVLEMFLWDKPAGLRAFAQTPERAAATKVLAANQGLYNGFLAAGLFWGLSQGSAGNSVKVFFSGLRAGRRRVWRLDCQPEDHLYPGTAGGAGIVFPLAYLGTEQISLKKT